MMGTGKVIAKVPPGRGPRGAETERNMDIQTERRPVTGKPTKDAVSRMRLER